MTWFRMPPWIRRVALAAVAVAGMLWLANTSRLADASTHRTKLLAHRGVHQPYAGDDRSADACHAAPVAPIRHGFLANTVSSMREAFRLGADAVELDVHPTTDGAFAVFHDWTLDCRTDGSGVTREYDLAALKALDVAHRIDDGTGSYPLRGTGIGAMPSLRDVLDAGLPGPVLVNVKSRDAEEGRALAARLAGAGDAILGIYGGVPPTDAALRAVPGLRGYTRASIRRCLLRYLALGWSGYVPAACRDTLLAVPLDYAPLLWGWPHRFTARMRRAGTDVILLGPYDGSGFSSGIDDLAALARVPERFDGYLWTDRIETVGPALRPALADLRVTPLRPARP